MDVELVFKNTGESDWTALAGAFLLGTQNPENNGDWGVSRVMLENEDLILSGDEKSFTFSITAPAAAGVYNFQWKMQNQDGWFGATSNNAVITVVSTVGVEDQLSTAGILISNPANSGRIKVQVSSMDEPLYISILSIDGRMLHQVKSSSLDTEINISHFEQGMYLVRVQQGEALKNAIILLD